MNRNIKYSTFSSLTQARRQRCRAARGARRVTVTAAGVWDRAGARCSTGVLARSARARCPCYGRVAGRRSPRPFGTGKMPVLRQSRRAAAPSAVRHGQDARATAESPGGRARRVTVTAAGVWDGAGARCSMGVLAGVLACWARARCPCYGNVAGRQRRPQPFGTGKMPVLRVLRQRARFPAPSRPSDRSSPRRSTAAGCLSTAACRTHRRVLRCRRRWSAPPRRSR